MSRQTSLWFDESSWKLVFSNGGRYPVIVGTGAPFIKKRIYDTLNPGDKIISIGTKVGKRGGKNSSSCRFFEFGQAVEYVGIIKDIFPDHPQWEHAAFKYEHEGEEIFLLWALAEKFGEIYLQDFKTLSLGIHQAIFEREK